MDGVGGHDMENDDIFYLDAAVVCRRLGRQGALAYGLRNRKTAIVSGWLVLCVDFQVVRYAGMKAHRTHEEGRKNA